MSTVPTSVTDSPILIPLKGCYNSHDNYHDGCVPSIWSGPKKDMLDGSLHFTSVKGSPTSLRHINWKMKRNTKISLFLFCFMSPWVEKDKLVRFNKWCLSSKLSVIYTIWGEVSFLGSGWVVRMATFGNSIQLNSVRTRLEQNPSGIQMRSNRTKMEAKHNQMR